MSFLCKHCNTEYSDSAKLLNANGEAFCCNGCLQTYEFLHSSDFGEFYTKLGGEKLDRAQICEFGETLVNSFYENFVTKNGNICEIFLVIKGVHCAACVWLIEKVLTKNEGVLDISVNGANAKAKLVWDETKTNLRDLLTLISRIGYNPLPYNPAFAEKSAKSESRTHYAKLVVAVACVMNIMWIAVALYSGYFSGISQEMKDILHFAEFVLASPVLFYTGSEFFKSAWAGVKSRHINMDLSVIGGASLAYAYSVWAMFARVGEVYFDSVAMVVAFVFVGKYFQKKALAKAVDFGDSLSGGFLSSVRVAGENGVVLTKPTEVKTGDEILVENGEKLLLDGVCVSGSGEFDYSNLTGESLPKSIFAGEAVKSGGVCVGGSLRYKATKPFTDGTLCSLLRLLENARLTKTKTEEVANLLSGKFTLVVVALAVVAFAFWAVRESVSEAVVVAMSVLIISCPCALSLATPVACLVGLNRALKRGVLFKEASVLERMGRESRFVFDKTGTLTKGVLKVVGVREFGVFDKGVLLALVESSTHLVSRAVAEFLRSQNVLNSNLGESESVVGGGLKGGGLVAGNARFLRENGVACEEGTGETLSFFVASGGVVVAEFALSDEVREASGGVVAGLKRFGSVAMLTGDKEAVALSVAKTLQICEVKFAATPEEKVEFVGARACVFVGDGVNDAAALSRASVGVALGQDVALSAQKADVILLSGDVAEVLEAVKISRTTRRRIYQNLAISLVYNVVAIPLAFSGVVIPLLAAAFMSASSLCVVLNAVRR